MTNSKKNTRTIVLSVFAGVLLGIAVGAGGVFYWKVAKPKYNHQIRVLTYRKWISPALVDKFLDREKILIEQDVASTVSEFLDKLADPSHDYDLVSVVSWQLPSAIDSRLLEPLKKTEVPSLKYIAADFRHLPQDKELVHSSPIFWGVNGIVYNQSKVGKKIKSWAEVFEDKNLANKVSLLNEPREIIAGLIRRQSITAQSITEESNNLKNSIEQILPFTRYSPVQALKLLGSEELWVAELPHGLASIPVSRSSDYVFVLPDESATLWTESLAIPKGTNKSAQAYKFIEFIMQKEQSMHLVHQFHYATASSLLENEPIHPMLKSSYIRSFPLNRLQVIEPINHMAKQWEQTIASKIIN